MSHPSGIRRRPRHCGAACRAAGWGLWDERLSREITGRAAWGQPDFGRRSNLVRRTESRVMRVEVGSNLRNSLESSVC
jgi:hypothetical protein